MFSTYAPSPCGPALWVRGENHSPGLCRTPPCLHSCDKKSCQQTCPNTPQGQKPLSPTPSRPAMSPLLQTDSSSECPCLSGSSSLLPRPLSFLPAGWPLSIPPPHETGTLSELKAMLLPLCPGCSTLRFFSKNSHQQLQCFP